VHERRVKVMTNYEVGTTIGGRALSQVKPKVITLSKDVQIASTPVYKYRDNEAPWSYEPSYNLDTAVRLGNMIANINETSDDPNTIGTDTNKALAQIVSVLLPDAKTTPK